MSQTWKIAVLVVSLFVAPSEAIAEPGAVIIVGIDRTAGWTEMTRDAVRVALTLARSFDQGDVVELRYISDASWPVNNHIGSVTLPVFTLRRSLTLQKTRDVAIKEKKQALLYEKARKRELLRYIGMLDSVGCLRATRTTDIAGFLQAASERFGAYDRASARRLVVISDFEERRHFSVDVDLSNVDIELFPLRQGDDPAAATERLQKWVTWLEDSTRAERIKIQRPVELPASRIRCE